MGEESWVGQRGQAALSGSKPKAPGSAGGYLLGLTSTASPLVTWIASSKGRKPPICRCRYELVINLKTAKALGLELPASVLGRANEVIE